MPEMWTTEQVADYLGLTIQDVYESRRRSAYPGNLGIRRGRQLLYPSDQVISPPEPETTTDPTTAILWALGGIHKTLRAIHNELRAQTWRDARGAVENNTDLDAVELIREGREEEE